MKQHDQVSWTSIISGCAQNGHGVEAILLFKKMLQTGAKPNCFTYVSVISASTEMEASVAQGRSFHAHVTQLGFETNNFVLSSLIDCYSKCGSVDQAASIFSAITNRDIIIYNSMISGYSQNLCYEEAFKLFIRMRSEDISLTDHSLSSILNACGSQTALQQGRQVHSMITKLGSESNVFAASALVDMYSKCGSVDEARCVFEQTVEKNSVLWTSIFSGYAWNGRVSEGLELFDQFLKEEGLVPDHICFTAILSACNHAGYLDRGLEYFRKMARDYGLIPELDQYACLVDLYARKGHLRKAKQFMEEMPFIPNDVMLSSFLSSCKIYGAVEMARETADQLFKMQPYNAAAYITMARMYAEADLWDEVNEIRKLINGKGLWKNAGSSWIEV
ncbi:hypothetical protein Nepgr_016541 [Nepenthes gracilis]|uniref:Pentatricopeptide repeat-containing protein n=1 Tax=Nepenthes gracilis TaxID=150966 RepID=A0AAD3XSL2_NEPGR|nr:hypothetical protein Nepgr_016541 [Nepenthes gracilis]